MRITDPNLPQLRRIARALGDLREQVVFVGGAVAGLLVTDPLSDGVRATRDVDAVVNADWLGFVRDAASEVICRWVHKASGLLFDLMPVHPEVLGFSNRWYPYAVETAELVDLGKGITIRLVSAMAFVATKMEAFAHRGGEDFMMNHDLEDVMTIVDGREELVVEMAAAPDELKAALSSSLATLLAHPDFANFLPGLIAEPERADLVMDRLKQLSR